MLAVCSCVNPLQESEPSAYPEGAKVTVRFTVAAEGIAPTKAQELGEDEALQSLHLAVFGSSGYLKEYVAATPGGVVGSIDFQDPNDPEKITNVPLYSFSAELTLTDSKRIIHFIGNGPSTLSFGYADAVLSSLLSTSGARAYWQMMTVDGIKAKTSDSAYEDQNGRAVEIGDYIDENGNRIINGEGYVVSPDTQDQFKEVPLVRNWAKIVVEADTNNNNDPYFEPISYAVVHVPDRGTLAPHSAATNGFIQDYQKKTYLDIVDLGYPANLPPKTVINDDIPDIEDFTYWDQEIEGHGDPAEVDGVGWRNGVAPAGRYGAVYLYERPVPSDQLPPTFVIVYGKYLNPEDTANKGKKCFYKIDLMTDRKYYPVYRNFQYRILIHSILSFGHPTPAAAAAAAGSADVSADINARHLPDISDGHRRLAVQTWMAKTFTHAQDDNTELSVYFMSDVPSDQPDMDPASVTLEVLPMKRGVDPVITDCRIDPPSENGWRSIHFTTNGPSNTIRSQTLRITGTGGGESIYRDVVITIQNIQPMNVRCSSTRIQTVKGSPVELFVSIPDGLPESMFPLEFRIEPEAMTLSPANDNLPVEYGESISGNGKSTFHYIKTLDRDEYLALPTELDESDNMWRRISCHFISNRDDSSTRIWVRNKDYFDPASTLLKNYSDKSFWDLRFLEPIKRNLAHQNLTLAFEVASDPDQGMPVVELTLDGLIPEAREDLPLPEDFTQVSDISYRFTPTAAHVQLPFYTTDADGEVYLQLSAADYESQSLRTHHFTLMRGNGFLDAHGMATIGGWSNVVYGKINSVKNKNVLFGYYDDPDALNPRINLIGLESNELTRKVPATYPWTPAGPRSADGDPRYHELEFQSALDDEYQNIDFVLSSPGYLEVEAKALRFRGQIYTYQNTDLNSNNVKGSPLALSNVDMGDKSNEKTTVTFTGDGFSVSDKGVTLAAGQTGTITITNNHPETYRLFYVQFNVNANGKKQLLPKMDACVVPVGSLEKYPGAANQLMWFLPDGQGSQLENRTITITAEEDRPTVIKGIVIKLFK